MSESKINSLGAKIGMWVFICLFVGVIIVALVVPNFVVPLSTSKANVCINNLRNIDLAKNIWALENKKATNDLPTWDDIKIFLAHDKPYYRFNPTNDLPCCPLGGIYEIGKISEMPTCSLGTNVVPAHFLP